MLFVVCGLSQAQGDMARQGEDVAAVDADDAYKNLAKTLSLLLERLEKMKTGISHKLLCFITVLDKEHFTNLIACCLIITNGETVCIFPDST